MTLNLHVTVRPIGLTLRTGEVGRPQTNSRIYLSLVGCDSLMREGATEKQIRRAAFASLRTTLGLPKTTVIARHTHGHFVVKSTEIVGNLVLTVSPAAVPAPAAAPAPLAE